MTIRPFQSTNQPDILKVITSDLEQLQEELSNRDDLAFNLSLIQAIIILKWLAYTRPIGLTETLWNLLQHYGNELS